MADEFVSVCLAGLHELACARHSDMLQRWNVGRTDNDDDDDDDTDDRVPLRLIAWHDSNVCHATEILWARYASSMLCSVEWHGCSGNVHRRAADNTMDRDGGLGVYAPSWSKSYVPNPRMTERSIEEVILAFARKLPAIFANMRVAWWVTDARWVLHWPFSRPPNAAADAISVPALVGRVVIQKYLDTHQLMMRQAAPDSQFNVVWQLYVRWAMEHGKTPLQPTDVLFGRVQYNVFFALVRRSIMPMFLQCTGITLPVARVQQPSRDAHQFITVTAKRTPKTILKRGLTLQ